MFWYAVSKYLHIVLAVPESQTQDSDTLFLFLLTHIVSAPALDVL